jgi:uncharacterized tellurite resistance protein B-like protein
MKNQIKRLEPLFNQLIAKAAPRFWHKNERIAFLKLVHEIFYSDSEYSNLEKAFFEDYSHFLGISKNDIDQMNLEMAIQILQEDKLQNDIIYILVAEAIFKDEDFDQVEQQFVETLSEKYRMSEIKLNSKIKEVRDRKIGEVLEDWYNRMETMHPENFL